MPEMPDDAFAARSRQMAKIRSKNTKPELAVRSLAFSIGYRFRLHVKTLPGKPDLVFPSRRKVIFVHGCFWHRHAGCKRASTPRTNQSYWLPKFKRNIQRDSALLEQLKVLGWDTMVVWECEVTDVLQLSIKLRAFLDDRLTKRRIFSEN